MEKGKIIFAGVVYSLILSAGCVSSKTQKEIDRKVAQETSINTRQDLTEKTDQLIESAQGLTEKQKTDLVNLREVTRIKNEQLNRESLRLKALLMKDLTSTDHSSNQIQILKRQIKKAEDKKLSNYFDAVSKASRILGKDQLDNDYVLRDFEYRYR